jgi:predicted nucleic acid-binding Zn ribbon protein
VATKYLRKKTGRRPSVSPRPTSQLMDVTFRWLKLDDKAQSYAAMRAFSAAALAAGGRVAENARGERLRGSILYVRVATASWAQHLQLMKELLLERMRREPGGAAVKELRFNIGPLEDVAAWERPETTVAAVAPPAAAPPPEVAAALDHVEDEELRAQLARLYGKLGSRKR